MSPSLAYVFILGGLSAIFFSRQKTRDCWYALSYFLGRTCLNLLGWFNPLDFGGSAAVALNYYSGTCRAFS